MLMDGSVVSSNVGGEIGQLMLRMKEEENRRTIHDRDGVFVRRRKAREEKDLTW